MYLAMFPICLQNISWTKSEKRKRTYVTNHGKTLYINVFVLTLLVLYLAPRETTRTLKCFVLQANTNIVNAFLLFLKKYVAQKLGNYCKNIVFTSISYICLCFFCFSGRLSIGNLLDCGIDKSICTIWIGFPYTIFGFLIEI